MRKMLPILLAMLFMASLLTGCKTTSSAPAETDPAAQPSAQDPELCMETCDQDCKVKWANSPMGYDYCFETCLDTCTSR